MIKSSSCFKPVVKERGKAKGKKRRATHNDNDDDDDTDTDVDQYENLSQQKESRLDIPEVYQRKEDLIKAVEQYAQLNGFGVIRQRNEADRVSLCCHLGRIRTRGKNIRSRKS